MACVLSALLLFFFLFYPILSGVVRPQVLDAGRVVDSLILLRRMICWDRPDIVDYRIPSAAQVREIGSP